MNRYDLLSRVKGVVNLGVICVCDPVNVFSKQNVLIIVNFKVIGVNRLTVFFIFNL